MIKKNLYDSLWKLETLLHTRIKTKKIHHVLEFNQSQWLKPYIEVITHKRIEAEKKLKGGADRKMKHPSSDA